MKYEVKGSIEIWWSIEVEADSIDEAKTLALDDLSGTHFDKPKGNPKIYSVEQKNK